MKALIVMQSVLLFLFVSCSTKPGTQNWVAPDIVIKYDTTLDCDDPAEPGCTVPSPFEALYEEAYDISGGKAPHYVNLLNIGDRALLVRIHLIRSAQISIDIQQFIWATDETASFIFKELVKAARRGVRVRIINDQLSAVGDARKVATAVGVHENLAIKIYNPTFDKLATSHLEIVEAGIVNMAGVNQRMHTKLLVVDEKIGIIGGRNHENKYFDRDPHFNFKDREIFIIGPEVQPMVRSFQEFWDYEFSIDAQHLKDVGAHLEAGDYDPYQIPTTVPAMLQEIDVRASDFEYLCQQFVDTAYRVEGQVKLFADEPGKPKENYEDATPTSWAGIRSVVQEATSSLVIQTPYLMFTKHAIKGLKGLREQHPNLRIMASTNSLAAADHFFTYATGMKQTQTMLKDLGFEIYELKPVPGDVRKMMPRYDQLAKEGTAPGEQRGERMPVKAEGPITGFHAKSFVVDERIALVGSHNFDPRSEDYDTQIVVAVWDEAVARALKENILRDMEPQNSWVVARQTPKPGGAPCMSFFASISRSLPVFDIWPYRYAASFELYEGQEPVPPNDPRFYERYENVGQFPGVEGSAKKIQTDFTTTMLGFATPLM